ncbi:MAG: hypothetical protein AAF653_02905 [Chloroflexota bacterium]
MRWIGYIAAVLTGLLFLFIVVVRQVGQVTNRAPQVTYLSRADTFNGTFAVDVVLYDVRHGLDVTRLSLDSIPSQLSWSPDGETLAFYPNPNARSITLYTPNTNTSQSIAFEDIQPDIARPIVWSPDGRQIAFASYSLATAQDGYALAIEQSTACIYDLETRQYMCIDADWGAVSRYVWSPDGEHFAISIRDVVYVLTAPDYALPRQIGTGTALVWTPDGHTLMSYSERDERIGTLPLDGEPVYTSLLLGNDPLWAPDSYAVVFTALASTRTSFDIWMYTIATGHTTPIAGTSTYEGQPAWSTDSRWIAYVATLNGRDDIILYNVENDVRYRLRGSRSRDWNPVWRPQQ